MTDEQTLPADRRSYTGVDRGFIFFETDPGVPWKGLTQVEELEDDYRIESYWIDGKKVSQRHIDGDYSAQVTSYDNPFTSDIFEDRLFGFSFREHYRLDDEDHYRLHLIHGLSIKPDGVIYNTTSPESDPSGYSWSMQSVDVQLTDSLMGSHLILDSALIFEWILRDIEDILYGWLDNTTPRIPGVEEMYAIFATMNLVIIDHGDGTWSAVGHETMIRMLDSTEFEINTPSAEYIDEETYDIESLIRDDRWGDQIETDNESWMPPAKDPFRDEDPIWVDEE